MIYRVKEFDEAEKRHLPEKTDPVSRRDFSKEWLEQVISNIRPRMDGLGIHPVPANANGTDVIYVVEIPKGTTAHMAKDHRYYMRYNFESVAMEDYQIRDVMNRAKMPSVVVEFGFECLAIGETHKYRLKILVKNQGLQVVRNFKLQFGFPSFVNVQPVSLVDRKHREANGIDIFLTLMVTILLFADQEKCCFRWMSWI